MLHCGNDLDNFCGSDAPLGTCCTFFEDNKCLTDDVIPAVPEKKSTPRLVPRIPVVKETEVTAEDEDCDEGDTSGEISEVIEGLDEELFRFDFAE